MNQLRLFIVHSWSDFTAGLQHAVECFRTLPDSPSIVRALHYYKNPFSHRRPCTVAHIVYGLSESGQMGNYESQFDLKGKAQTERDHGISVSESIATVIINNLFLDFKDLTLGLH